MLLYSRYISKKIFIGFAGFVTVLVSLIWFSRAIGFMNYVTENGIELSKFLYLFILILPWILLFIIPVSLFVTILIIYNRLIASNEITILKNSGLTKFSLSKPAIFPTILSSIICLFISFYLMPYSNKEMRNLRNDFKNNYTNLSFNAGTFENLNNLTIYTKSRDKNNQLFSIILHDEKSEKNSITITAKSGRIESESSATLLYMEQGTIQKFNYQKRTSEILHFDNYVFNLSENQKSGINARWKTKERYFSELLFPEEDTEIEDLNKFRAEIHRRITSPLLPIILALISLSCAMHGKFNRSGNVSNTITAIVQATIFMISTILISNLIESSSSYIFLLYTNFIIFFIISFKRLSDNYRIIKNK